MPGTTAPRTDAPRTNSDPAEIERKKSLLREPHVEALTDFVEELRASRPDAHVPYFDPTEAGTGARILLLLEAPGPQAALDRGSGFVSPDNDDQSAENMWHLLRDAGVHRGREVVTWNVVPWYLGDGAKIRAPGAADLEQGYEHTRRLLGLLPEVRVVVLLGKQAARQWQNIGSDLDSVEAPHPSPQNLNTRPEQRDRIRAALSEARSRSSPPADRITGPGAG